MWLRLLSWPTLHVKLHELTLMLVSIDLVRSCLRIRREAFRHLDFATLFGLSNERGFASYQVICRAAHLGLAPLDAMTRAEDRRVRY
jgi:hypothetical protein